MDKAGLQDMGHLQLHLLWCRMIHTADYVGLVHQVRMYLAFVLEWCLVLDVTILKGIPNKMSKNLAQHMLTILCACTIYKATVPNKLHGE